MCSSDLMAYGGRVKITPSEIGDMLGMKKQNVYNSTKKLVATGIILKSGRGIYYVSPRYKWKGEAKYHKEALQREHNHRLGIKNYWWGVSYTPKKLEYSSTKPQPERIDIHAPCPPDMKTDSTSIIIN